MTFEADLRAHLAADATISGLVADRINPMKRSSASRVSAIVFQRVAVVPMTNLAGGDGDMENIRVQTDCFATTYDAVRTLAEAVKSRMQTASSTFKTVLSIEQEIYEDDTDLYRVIMDFSCWYRTS